MIQQHFFFVDMLFFSLLLPSFFLPGASLLSTCCATASKSSFTPFPSFALVYLKIAPREAA